MNIQEAFNTVVSKYTSNTARATTSVALLDMLVASTGTTVLNNRLSFETQQVGDKTIVKMMSGVDVISTVQFKNGHYTLNNLSAPKRTVALKLFGNIIKSNLN